MTTDFNYGLPPVWNWFVNEVLGDEGEEIAEIMLENSNA